MYFLLFDASFDLILREILYEFIFLQQRYEAYMGVTQCDFELQDRAMGVNVASDLIAGYICIKIYFKLPSFNTTLIAGHERLKSMCDLDCYYLDHSASYDCIIGYILSQNSFNFLHI